MNIIISYTCMAVFSPIYLLLLLLFIHRPLARVSGAAVVSVAGRGTVIYYKL